MNKTISVVICTFNRPEHVDKLVEELKSFHNQILEIIVVDSSTKDNDLLQSDSTVNYIKSDRKSQPYQRWLGASACRGEIVAFFDDDVLVLDNKIFFDIDKEFHKKEIVGVSLGIRYETGIQLNANERKKDLPNTGKISWLGRTTGLPCSNMYVEYFPGPIMVYRRSILDKLFDEVMFSMFEKRIAMGEDKVISMRASKYGRLMFLGAKNYLHHPPIASTYFNNNIEFIAKTTFSRLWLSKEFARSHSKPIWIAHVIFWLYLAKQLVLGLANRTKLKGNLMAIKWLVKN